MRIPNRKFAPLWRRPAFDKGGKLTPPLANISKESFNFIFGTEGRRITCLLVSSGAKVCKSCSSWKMLQNDYLVAKIGADTAENELRKSDVSCRDLMGNLPEASAKLMGALRTTRRLLASCSEMLDGQLLDGSFSAGSTPIFATKQSFFSIFRGL